MSRSPSLLGPPWRTWLPPACLPRGPRAWPEPHLHPSSSPSPDCAPGAGSLASRAASGTKPGLLGLGPWAGVTLALSVDSSPRSSGCPWPPGVGPAARVLRSALRQPSTAHRGQNLGSSAGPSSSQFPTPNLPPWAPPPRPVLASGPRPRSPLQAPAAAAPTARVPPLPWQPGLSRQINGQPDTPALPVQHSASQSQTDTQRWRDRPVTGRARNTRAHGHIQSAHTDRSTAGTNSGHRRSRADCCSKGMVHRRQPDMGSGCGGTFWSQGQRAGGLAGTWGARGSRSPAGRRAQEASSGGEQEGAAPPLRPTQELQWEGQERAQQCGAGTPPVLGLSPAPGPPPAHPQGLDLRKSQDALGSGDTAGNFAAWRRTGHQAGPVTKQCWAMLPRAGGLLWPRIWGLDPCVTVRPPPYPPLPVWEGNPLLPWLGGRGKHLQALAPGPHPLPGWLIILAYKNQDP